MNPHSDKKILANQYYMKVKHSSYQYMFFTKPHQKTWGSLGSLKYKYSAVLLHNEFRTKISSKICYIEREIAPENGGKDLKYFFQEGKVLVTIMIFKFFKLKQRLEMVNQSFIQVFSSLNSKRLLAENDILYNV